MIRNIFALAVALLMAGNLCADEGMWLLGRTDKKAMDMARSLGLQLTDEQLYGEDGTSLKDCVVDFGDYCSGVIVSVMFFYYHSSCDAHEYTNARPDIGVRNRDEEAAWLRVRISGW